jgi:cytosine/adenosine deaminase-related metal-dependent hydrolase
MLTNKLIQNCSILDNRSPSGTLDHQDILIRGNRITAIQPTGEPPEGALLFDGTDLLAFPGLVNAHTHSPENILRATTERMPLELWLVAQFSFLPKFPTELIRLTTLAGCAEMLRSGTTSVIDHFWMPEGLTLNGLNAAMETYSISGMRVALAPMIEDRDSILSRAERVNPDLIAFQTPGIRPQNSLAILDEFLGHWDARGDSRLKGLPGPGGLQWCSDELLLGCLRLAEKYNTGIHLHLNETRLQARICQEDFGKPAALHLNELGLIGNTTSIAHAVWMTLEELDLLASSKATVVHNPVSNLKLGSGIARIPEMLDRGINVALGTDGAASNDNQNMFGTMKVAGLFHSPAVSPSSRWLGASEVFEMATEAGAKVICPTERLGRIAPGYLADLVLVDRTRTFNTPLQDPLDMLIFSETGASIQDVMVDGEWVVWHGKVTTFDEHEIYCELAREAKAYFDYHPRRTTQIQGLIDAWSTALKSIQHEEEIKYG